MAEVDRQLILTDKREDTAQKFVDIGRSINQVEETIEKERMSVVAKNGLTHSQRMWMHKSMIYCITDVTSG